MSNHLHTLTSFCFLAAWSETQRRKATSSSPSMNSRLPAEVKRSLTFMSQLAEQRHLQTLIPSPTKFPMPPSNKKPSLKLFTMVLKLQLCSCCGEPSEP